MTGLQCSSLQCQQVEGRAAEQSDEVIQSNPTVLLRTTQTLQKVIMTSCTCGVFFTYEKEKQEKMHRTRTMNKINAQRQASTLSIKNFSLPKQC